MTKAQKNYQNYLSYTFFESYQKNLKLLCTKKAKQWTPQKKECCKGKHSALSFAVQMLIFSWQAFGYQQGMLGKCLISLSLENVGECLLLQEVELIVTDLYQMHGYKCTILTVLFLKIKDHRVCRK